LPWQVDPTPIASQITPFAGLATNSDPPLGVVAPGSPAAGGGTPAASPIGSPSASPEASPVASPVASPAAGGAAVYAIDGARSEVRYVVREQLAGFSTDSDAVGTTHAIVGAIAFDANGLPTTGSTFKVDLRTLTSDKVRRDNDIKKYYLETAKFPVATFVFREVQGLTGPLVDGQTVPLKIVGDLTAHGVTKSITWDATASRAGDTLTGKASTTFRFEDFGMDVPDIAGMVSAQNPIRLELDITADRDS
jgi:polyisoprenoid-binding protein YceI